MRCIMLRVFSAMTNMAISTDAMAVQRKWMLFRSALLFARPASWFTYLAIQTHSAYLYCSAMFAGKFGVDVRRHHSGIADKLLLFLTGLAILGIVQLKARPLRERRFFFHQIQQNLAVHLEHYPPYLPDIFRILVLSVTFPSSGAS